MKHLWVLALAASATISGSVMAACPVGGDVTCDHQRDLLDVMCTIEVALYDAQSEDFGEALPSVPTCIGGGFSGLEHADADCNGFRNVTDAQLAILRLLISQTWFEVDSDQNFFHDACQLECDLGSDDCDGLLLFNECIVPECVETDLFGPRCSGGFNHDWADIDAVCDDGNVCTVEWCSEEYAACTYETLDNCELTPCFDNAQCDNDGDECTSDHCVIDPGEAAGVCLHYAIPGCGV